MTPERIKEINEEITKKCNKLYSDADISETRDLSHINSLTDQEVFEKIKETGIRLLNLINNNKK